MVIIERISVLEGAITTFGTRHQKDMAIEEMSELIKALCKERRTLTVGGVYFGGGVYALFGALMFTLAVWGVECWLEERSGSQ